jgi:hypothetical protein
MTQPVERPLATVVPGAQIYGVSVWNIKVNDGTRQQNLIITLVGNDSNLR